MHRFRQTISNPSGFTLLEIAIVMVIIGLLTGGGISLMKMLTERKARNEAVAYLQQARSALISYTVNNGRLPWADGNHGRLRAMVWRTPADHQRLFAVHDPADGPVGSL